MTGASPSGEPDRERGRRPEGDRFGIDSADRKARASERGPDWSAPGSSENQGRPAGGARRARAKDLSDMTLDELWQLFPIILKDHDPAYAHWYGQERASLATIWGGRLVRIGHIGSTAVPGLVAKPTVDILLELDGVDPREAIDRHLDAGWLLMSGQDATPLRLVFNKGYTRHGFAERVFHLHVRPPGDWDEPYFRDYLIDHPDAARDYERLKLALARRFEHDRDAYTEAKTAFIAETTAKARELYGPRYAMPR